MMVGRQRCIRHTDRLLLALQSTLLVILLWSKRSSCCRELNRFKGCSRSAPTLQLRAQGMLQALFRPLPGKASLHTTASCVHSFRTFPLAPANLTMDRLRQRKPVTERAVTRSRTFEKRALTVHSTPDVAAEPATKKRKRAPSKRKAKGLDEIAKDGSTAASSAPAQAVQTSASADTTYDAVPAISSTPSGVPTSTPADISRDPNVLHCWTKQSMADAAAQLAQRDAGATVSFKL